MNPFTFEEQVFSQNGYSIELMEKAVPLEFFIKPDWITFDTYERKKHQLKLYDENKTQIYLNEIWLEEFGDELQVGFHISRILDHEEGNFLSNTIFYPDGKNSVNFEREQFAIFDSNHQEIEVKQIGASESSFSLGIDKKQLPRIKNGFYVKYTGMNLYQYEKDLS
ncbi:hypothetical protein NV379_16750 [Paenibacillus sp. N1-5-1-14]|uniref:hypothetical protein n=1 Tax=Paenibacillus radicibacter TaxID=2972488 RepID=UPI0021599800|nr:hypothetical protein [Paenibacillus radicibacter]MCR8644304.1 hypothetical protein [Paenibacillus radicibacter]